MSPTRPFYSGLLSLISGTALWLSFSSSLFPLAWVGLVPYLYFLLRRPAWKWVLIGHGLMALVYLGGVLYWIPRVLVVYGDLSWVVALPTFLLMLITLSLILLPFSLLTRWAAEKSVSVALLCIPGFWLLTVRNSTGEDPYYRVWVGQFKTPQQAAETNELLRQEGFSTYITKFLVSSPTP